MKDRLNELQDQCNKLYAEQGLSDEVLDLQIRINKLRFENDIVDESEKVYEDFVQ